MQIQQIYYGIQFKIKRQLKDKFTSKYESQQFPHFSVIYDLKMILAQSSPSYTVNSICKLYLWFKFIVNKNIISLNITMYDFGLTCTRVKAFSNIYMCKTKTYIKSTHIVHVDIPTLQLSRQRFSFYSSTPKSGFLLCHLLWIRWILTSHFIIYISQGTKELTM